MGFDASSFVFKYFDTLTSHEFCDGSSWPLDENEEITSIWNVVPSTNEIFEITDTRIFLSSDVILNDNVIIEMWSDSFEYPLKTITYNGRKDFLCRAESIEKIGHACAVGNNVINDVHIYVINFAQKVILWNSTGLYKGLPKLNNMTVRLGNNLPLKNVDNEPGQLARCRYCLAVYSEN